MNEKDIVILSLHVFLKEDVPMEQFHQVVIVGGGTAGITVAAQLKRQAKGIDVAIVDPADKHYYQPLWTLVGAGIFDKSKSERSEASLIPKGVTWYQQRTESFQPEENTIQLQDGSTMHYKYLVVCPGIQLDWDNIEGLEENLGKNGVCSNYSYEHVQYTWECIRDFRGGNAIFSYPQSAVKCGGAPQKIMYLAEEAFRKQGVRDLTNVSFYSANPGIFSVEKYTKVLNQIIEDRDIHAHFQKNLIHIDGENRKATFQDINTKEKETVSYDMLHAVPYMSSPDFVANSSLADDNGWVDVNAYTLRHSTYANVFSLGDVCSAPTSKTGAAIRKQAPTVVSNMLALMNNKQPWKQYDGYTSCPLVTGYSSLIMAEFKYGNVPSETFPIDQSKERYSMFLMKKYGLPAMYWHGMMKGLV